jgi:hypothetical protein
MQWMRVTYKRYERGGSRAALNRSFKRTFRPCNKNFFGHQKSGSLCGRKKEYRPIFETN